jgi:hypothetical protein
MLDGDPPPKEEFVAEENMNFKRPKSVGAMSAMMTQSRQVTYLCLRNKPSIQTPCDKPP